MKKNNSKVIDDGFIYQIQPAGGLDTKSEYLVRLGSVFMACVHVYEIPDTFSDFWLKKLTAVHGATAVVDYYTNPKINYAKQISSSISELEIQRHRAYSTTESDLIDQELLPLRQLSVELNKQGEVIKQVSMRIYLYADSVDHLNRKVNDVISDLATDGYGATVFLDENADEYKSMFLPIVEQSRLPSGRTGLPLSGQVMGLGYAHNQTSLSDPYGSYFGYTPTGGTVYWDMFRVTNTRTYYNTFLSGDLGSGKSTSLKKILWERAIRGDLVRVFDRTGEFATLVRKFKGTVINLDGSDGIINMFQVYPTQYDEKTSDPDVIASYRAHIGGLAIKYRLLDRDADERTANAFSQLCDRYYKQHHYLDPDRPPVTALAATEYPTLSDIVPFIQDASTKGLYPEMTRYYESILLSLGQLKSTFGDLFDGYSSFPDLSDLQVVSYQLSTIDAMQDSIQDLQIYNAIIDSYNNCMRLGRAQKKAYDAREKGLIDVQHWLMIIDECHTILNTDKSFVANFFVKLMSEDRKMFGSIVLATQRLERMFPSGANVSDKGMVKAVNALNQLYSLCQYKVLMKHDVSTIKTKEDPGILRSLFGNMMTEQDFASLPDFGKGEAYLLIGTDKLHMNFQVTDEELRTFEGGA